MQETLSKSSEILQYIRRSLLLKLPYPTVLLILVVLVFCFLPLRDAFSPVSLEQPPSQEQIEESICVSQKLDTLYYTGYDYRRNDILAGHFYYRLADGRCDFYLIAAGSDPIAQPVLSDYVCTGRIESDSELRTELIQAVAEDVSWTEAGLRRIASGYYINELSRFEFRYILLACILTLCGLASLFSLCRMLLYLLFPTLSPAYRRLKHYGNAQARILAVENEMGSQCIIRTRDMCLTPGYLVEFSEDLSAIVPLEAVLWAYDYSTLHSFFGFRPYLTYTLHLVMMTGETYSFKHKRKEDVDKILNELSLRFPNFFIGYSEEHRKIVRHILKEEKKSRLRV